jgi:hypothetical protein
MLAPSRMTSPALGPLPMGSDLARRGTTLAYSISSPCLLRRLAIRARLARRKSPLPRRWLPVKGTASAVSLNVEDVAASSLFLHQHFGFAGVMAADGFASLDRHDIGRNVVYLRRGLPALPGGRRDVHATGLIVVFAVGGLESEPARLQAEGAQVTAPLTCEGWGSGPSRSATPAASSSRSPAGMRPPAPVSRPWPARAHLPAATKRGEYEREVASGPMRDL